MHHDVPSSFALVFLLYPEVSSFTPYKTVTFMILFILFLTY